MHILIELRNIDISHYLVAWSSSIYNYILFTKSVHFNSIKKKKYDEGNFISELQYFGNILCCNFQMNSIKKSNKQNKNYFTVIVT